MTSEKELEADLRTIGQIGTVANKVMKKQDVNSGTAGGCSNNWVPATSKIPQPKIDATDRRQIEAQNEDKSHTTKEALDDIKHVHNKEKRKKEQNNMERCQFGINPDGWVSKILIL